MRREGPPVPKYPLPRDYAFGGALMEREAKDVRREGPPVPKYPLPRDYAFGGGLMDRDDVWAGIECRHRVLQVSRAQTWLAATGLAVAASLFALGFLVGGH